MPIYQPLSKVQVVSGSYIGNGAASQLINVGFTPKAVWVFSDQVTDRFGSIFHADAGCSSERSNMDRTAEASLTLAANGFNAILDDKNTNAQTYYYVAIA